MTPVRGVYQVPKPKTLSRNMKARTRVLSCNLMHVFLLRGVLNKLRNYSLLRLGLFLGFGFGYFSFRIRDLCGCSQARITLRQSGPHRPVPVDGSFTCRRGVPNHYKDAGIHLESPRTTQLHSSKRKA